ncbi:MAG: hypothetical protein J0L92_03275 [Deltaproteobacteria bacterium]|nr:hypothetical protein [Deltaproteobacteria bacterium]
MRTIAVRVAGVFVVTGLAAACDPSGASEDAGRASDMDAPGLDAPGLDAPGLDAHAPAPIDADRGDTQADALLPSSLGPFAFRRGVNPGYYGPGIDRRESAQLSVGAGASSIRGTLPERYLARWGDEIEVGDYAYYAEQGLDDHAVFLIGPSAEHSSAPAGTPDWELDHYAPRNLYEPIFLPDGRVNPENHWASYVDRVARTYGDHIAIYEVWNEPDQVLGNWMVTTEWDTRAPTASELVWWNDTIYAYVRALRITHEVVHRADPDAQVTVGGVGYPNFLRAVLRYTDEPTSGAVDADHPYTGGHYLDVLSFHYYPVFGGGSSDRGVEGLLEQRDAMRETLTEVGLGDLGFVVTETGAPRVAVGTTPGSPLYAASYLVKAMVLGHHEGWVGIDWFAQGEGDAAAQATDSFQSMGLYESYAMAMSPSEVRRTAQGDAYAWLATWMNDTAADPALTAGMELPTDARGVAFRRSDGSRVYVVWAHTGGDESATASWSIASDASALVRTFAVGAGRSERAVAPESGRIAITLGSMPTVIELP